MWETFFGFKKTPFADNPDGKQLFASQAWQQVKTRLEFLVQHRGVGLLTGEVGSGKSTAARAFTSALPAHQYKILMCTSPPVRHSICCARSLWN
jgi:type II secretory pathway predicted ATPase ExeA